MQLKVLFGRKSHGRPDLKRERKQQQQRRVFFDVIFDVYTHVDNRERERASDWKQRRRISWEEKHENFIAAVRKRKNASGQQGENERQWKNKSEHEHRKQNLW